MDKILHYLFTSQTRIKVLQLFFTHINETFHVRGIVRQVDEEINSVRRELARLKSIGLLRSERRQNRLFYRLNNKFILFPELQRIVGKSTGLGHKIIKNQSSLGRIKFATIAMRYLVGEKAAHTEVDLLAVGRLNLDELKEIIRSIEKSTHQEINYTVMTEEEFSFRKKRRDQFVRDVLTQPHLVLIGNEMELLKF